MGQIKANFDGSTKGNPRKVGCRGISRDHCYRVVNAIVIPIGHSTSHIAKVMVTLYTVKLAMDSGYRKLWLEGDSLNIINMINNKSMTTQNIEGSIIEIKELIKNID